MRSKDKERLGALRLIQAAFKQKEVDERQELDDAAVLSVIEKMLKQRKDSIKQFEAAQRDDLAEAEKAEVDILSEYMPAALSEKEIDALVADAISAADAKGMQDMGKVMAILKPKLVGRADMGKVSALVKGKISA